MRQVCKGESMIETSRLMLRSFVYGDAEDVFAYLKEPTVNCFAFMKVNTLSEVNRMIRERINKNELCFAIVLKENGKVIGEIEAYQELTEPHDKNHPSGIGGDTFSPSWMLNKAYQRNGYAFEAAKAFFNYLFQKKGARRIYAYTEADNISSQRLCEKLGMRLEGTFLEFISFVKNSDGAALYENTKQYAILEKEWTL